MLLRSQQFALLVMRASSQTSMRGTAAELHGPQLSVISRKVALPLFHHHPKPASCRSLSELITTRVAFQPKKKLTTAPGKRFPHSWGGPGFDSKR